MRTCWPSTGKFTGHAPPLSAGLGWWLRLEQQGPVCSCQIQHALAAGLLQAQLQNVCGCNAQAACRRCTAFLFNCIEEQVAVLSMMRFIVLQLQASSLQRVGRRSASRSKGRYVVYLHDTCRSLRCRCSALRFGSQGARMRAAVPVPPGGACVPGPARVALPLLHRPAVRRAARGAELRPDTQLHGARCVEPGSIDLRVCCLHVHQGCAGGHAQVTQRGNKSWFAQQ